MSTRADRREIQRDPIDRIREAAFSIEDDLGLEFVLGERGVQQQRPGHHGRVGHGHDRGLAPRAGLAAGTTDGFANDCRIAYIAPVNGRRGQRLDRKAINATARPATGEGDDLDRRRADVETKWRSGSPFEQPHMNLLS